MICWQLPHGQPIERAGNGVQILSATMQIDHRRREARVTEQAADGQQIDARFQHPGGPRMS